MIDYFKNDAHLRILEELIHILDIKYYIEKTSSSDSIFSWKKVCITWSFESNWEKVSRDDLVIKLEEVWWEFVGSVSKNTDYLLAWEKAWSKLEKANSLWVNVINLDYFLGNL